MWYCFGKPISIDRKTTFHRHEYEYHLFKDGFEYIVRAHRKKLNLSPVNAGEMKRIVNASHNFALLMFKDKDAKESKALQGYESSLKYYFIDVVNPCDKMF